MKLTDVAWLLPDSIADWAMVACIVIGAILAIVAVRENAARMASIRRKYSGEKPSHEA